MVETVLVWRITKGNDFLYQQMEIIVCIQIWYQIKRKSILISWQVESTLDDGHLYTYATSSKIHIVTRIMTVYWLGGANSMVVYYDFMNTMVKLKWPNKYNGYPCILLFILSSAMSNSSIIYRWYFQFISIFESFFTNLKVAFDFLLTRNREIQDKLLTFLIEWNMHLFGIYGSIQHNYYPLHKQ